MKTYLSPVLATALLGGIALSAAPARAHFKLLKPASWLNEDGLGGPQKGMPCGTGGSDDVQPAPTSGMVTTVHAGETIMVEWEATIPHPGYFRIALSEHAAADNPTDLPKPPLAQDAFCSFDESMVPSGAHDNIIADGLFFVPSGQTPADTHYMQEITLPNKTCDKCALQIVQVMEDDIQALSNCYYVHCADLKILPADGSTGGNTGADAGGAKDAGPATDAADTKDAGSSGGGSATDAGAARDAGHAATDGDDGQGDAGVAEKDAGTHDAGTKSDAGTHDAGTNHGASSQSDGDDNASDDSSSNGSGGSDGCSVAYSDTEATGWLLLMIGALILRRRRQAETRAS